MTTLYPCSVQPTKVCDGCNIHGKLMCRFEIQDSVHFFMSILPFFVTTIAGVISSGYGWYLLGWLAYAIFFFFVWEGRVLCSHCPYWAGEGRILRCHANYGVIKIWKYQPGPMSRSEQLQLIVRALLFFIYPLIFLFLGRQYLLGMIALVSAFSCIYMVRRNVCSRCINSSCPVNCAPEPLLVAYLSRNPEMKKAWEACGYRSSENP